MFRRRDIISAAFALSASLAAIALPAGITSRAKFTLLAAANPFTGVLQTASTSVRHEISNLFSYRRLARENNYLRVQVQQLNSELLHYKEFAAENRRLKELLKFTVASDRKWIAARVVGRDSVSWFKTVTIDRGTKSGVHRGMYVVSTGGLVGRVVETGPSASRVSLIINSQSRVAALITREGSREEGIVAGDGLGSCWMKYLFMGSDVRSGDVVASSGMGRLFPKGLPIGEISKVEWDTSGLYKKALIVPYVDFSKLEEVLCAK